MGEHKRVAGHTLRYEGAPMVLRDRRPMRATDGWGVGGKGFGLCSCGQRSPIYDSASLRRAWHRAHKAEVVARG